MSVSYFVGSSANNNGGVVIKGNTNSNSVVSTLVNTNNTPNAPQNTTGHTVKDNATTNKAVSAGTFAYSGGRAIVIGANQNSIGGIPNTALSQSFSPNYRKHYNTFDTTFKQDLTTSGIRANNWSYVSGVFITTRGNQDVIFAPDREGSGSRTFVGMYQVKGPARTIQSNQYQSKVNG